MISLYLSTQTWAVDSALIRWHTCCEFSHVGFCDGDGQLERYFSAQLRGGVRWRSAIGAGVARESYGQILRVTAPGIDDAFTWALTQNLKKYDYSAIFGLALNRDWRNGEAWYCAELVAAAFEKTGHALFNPQIALWRITPRDILLSPYVQLEGKGIFHEQDYRYVVSR
jgi:uncharacterized protein YycO